jgi:hypothetical protein
VGDKKFKIVIGNPDGKTPLGRARVHGRIILMQILKKCGIRMCTGLSWLGIGSSGGLLQTWK